MSYFKNINCTINNFYQKLQNEEFKFKIAQILFILSVTCGWYLHDLIRRLLFIFALLLTSKKQRQIPIIENWHGMVKIAGYCTIVFGTWVLLIPLLFGVDPFLERLLSTARPLEVGLWVWGVLFFAQNNYFKKHIARISIASCFFLVAVLFIQRTLQSFAPIYDGWVLCDHAAWAGMGISFLLPWVFCGIVNSKSKTWPLYIIFILSITVIISTYLSTMWIALFIQLFLLVVILLKSKNYIPLAKIFSVMALCFLLLLPLYKFQPTFQQRVNAELVQLSNLNKDIKVFTSKRNYLWDDAINLIQKRKIFGYGWTEYIERSALINENKAGAHTHPHSSYLQVAFYTGIIGGILFILTLLSLFIVGLKSIFKDKISPFPFVVTLAIATFTTASLAESFFYVGREVIIPIWATLALVLTPVNNKP